MKLSRLQIESLDRVRRLNLINSITGIKPCNLVGTVSKDGISNLAIISSVVHLSSNPALIGFFMRPHKEVRRDTFENILGNKVYSINQVPTDKVKNAHYTSAKVDQGLSEFDLCGLTEEYHKHFEAPFVKESLIKIGLSLEELTYVKSSDTTLVVGLIQQLIIPDKVLNEQYYIDLSKANSVGVSGLNSYYQLNYLESFPYARKNEIPEFGGELP